jgi:transposase
MQQIEQREGECIEEILRRKYVDENKLITLIAKELQISYVTTYKWLNLAGIHSRKLNL